MREHIERDVLLNSKYIIAYFKKKDASITHLMLQKLLYFLEALYMVSEDEDYLFNDDFYAWNFGPVNDIVYSEYKIFGKLPLELYDEDENIKINPINERFIDNLYEMFKDFNSYDLVSLSHAKGSPWNEIYEKFGLDIPEDIKIDKIKTKEWFNSLVRKVPNEE